MKTLITDWMVIIVPATNLQYEVSTSDNSAHFARLPIAMPIQNV